MNITPISGPHTHSARSIASTMRLVMLALLPATLFSFYLFGWPAIILFCLTLVSAWVIEAACLRISGKPMTPYLTDGSALLTAWLLALSLPPWAPWWIAVVGAAFAIILGKHVFGGLGQNLFNPAMLARCALLIAFPLEMTRWVTPVPIDSSTAPGFFEALTIIFGSHPIADSITAATTLGHTKTEFTLGHTLSQSLGADFLGNDHLIGIISGSLGETSAPLLLAGGLFLLAKGVIRWHIPVAMLGSIALISTLMHLIDPERYGDALFHLLSGSIILGAFFIATDLVTSPNTPLGQTLYGVGCGLLTYLIRTWGSFPEGVAFAVLLMNSATPIIDHYVRPRIYGRSFTGAPLPLTSLIKQDKQP